MDDSHKRIQLKKEANASLFQILISFLLALIGLVAGMLAGGKMMGEFLGPVLALAGFIWGISIAKKRE